MIRTFGDIRNQVIVRLGITTTSGYYTDTILNDFVNSAQRFCTGYKKWPFTEGRISTTYTGSEELLFEGYKADSFRMLLVDGKRFQKLNYEDYLILKEEEPSSTEKVFSTFGRLVIVNPQSGVSGTLTAYGQLSPTDIDVTDLTATTVFSNGDEDGNEAIVNEAISYAYTREKKDNEANVYHQKAIQILDTVWSKAEDEKFTEQTHRSRGGMFKRINILGGQVSDELIRRDQFPFS